MTKKIYFSFVYSRWKSLEAVGKNKFRFSSFSNTYIIFLVLKFKSKDFFFRWKFPSKINEAKSGRTTKAILSFLWSYVTVTSPLPQFYRYRYLKLIVTITVTVTLTKPLPKVNRYLK